MTPAERIAELEAQRADALAAENAQFRALLAQLQADNARLLDLLEGKVADLKAGAVEPTKDRPACQIYLPSRRCRPGGRRRW